jgi:hypothetical protein
MSSLGYGPAYVKTEADATGSRGYQNRELSSDISRFCFHQISVHVHPPHWVVVR